MACSEGLRLDDSTSTRLGMHHQEIGVRWDLFHEDACAPGGVFWHGRGMAIRGALMDAIRDGWRARGYQEVCSPDLALASGVEADVDARDVAVEHMLVPWSGQRLAISRRPCDAHCRMLVERTRGLDSFPLRYAEFALCRRRLRTEDRRGLLRMMEYSADTMHVYCLRQQIEVELAAFHDHCVRFLRGLDLLGFRARRLRKVSGGSEARPSNDCRLRFQDVLNALSVDEDMEVETPHAPASRVEYVAEDRSGVGWRLGCVEQGCCDSRWNGQEQRSWREAGGLATMHGAAVGSLERCIGLILERHGLNLPIWLAPVQAHLVAADGVTASRLPEIAAHLEAAGVRTRIGGAPMAGPGGPSAPCDSLQASEGAPLAVVVEAGGALHEGHAMIHRRGSRSIDRIPLEQAVGLLGRECAPPGSFVCRSDEVQLR